MTRRPILASVTALSVVLSTAALAAPASADPPDGPRHVTSTSIDPARATKTLASLRKISGLDDASGPVTAFVQLDTPAAIDVSAEPRSDAADVKAAATTTRELATDVVPTKLTDANADSSAPKRIATLTNLVSGTLVTGDAGRIRALASNDNVVAIYRVAHKTVQNSNTVAFTRALQTWQDTGHTGAGVRIGVIDTGLDYTHADFGGPGTKAAYDEAYGDDGTAPIPAGLFDSTKFIGGYDFAGTNYNADPSDTTPGATTVPAPDPNPIDVYGHGTHVAGSAAGFGVQADGSTFRGDYSTLTSLDGWKIGPGSAPKAEIYALKVFGDIDGSTDLVSLALDRAADPNGDGDLSDHLDVLNLSLGGDGAPADDPEDLLVNQLTKLGAVVVIASGNAGDITDVGGSPGNAAGALTVANSVAKPVVDAVKVTAAADSSLVGDKLTAQNSIAYTGDDVTAPVAYVGAKFDGCAAFTGDQASQVSGKIAYLWWDDDDTTRACGSATRFNNATAAGAVGVLLPSGNDIFTAGISGNDKVPGAQMTKTTTQALLPEIEGGTLSLEIGPELANASSIPGYEDTLNDSSSRGVHGSLGVSKPDVAAPGTNIYSAWPAQGTTGVSISGTSMATPNVAGIAALVRSTHPTWDAEQVKAAVVNTATHDVWTEPGGTGTAYGPQRVGSGRVDALNAVSTDVIAYNTQEPELTSVTFGVVDVAPTATVVKKQTVTVKNLGTTSAQYTTAFAPSTTTPGATITAVPSTVTVGAGDSATVTLTLTVSGADLARANDPTSATYQAGLAREFVTEVAGRLVLTSGTQELRVPVQSAPRLVSSLTGSNVAFANAASTTGSLKLSGEGFDRPTWTSLTSPLILGATSPRVEASASVETSETAIRSGDLRYVGWASTVPYIKALGGDAQDLADYGQLAIGIAVDGDWASPGVVVNPQIDLDVDHDGTTDLVAVVWKLDPSVDLTVVTTFDTHAPADADPVSVELVNNQKGDVDTGIFDSSVLVAPINLAGAGLKAGDKPDVTVTTWSPYAAASNQLVDQAPTFRVDPFNPPYWFETDYDFTSSVGENAATIPVHRAAGAASAKLLLLHHHNSTPGTRAQVVSATVPPSTKTTTSLSVSGSTAYGKVLTLSAAVSPSSAAGRVAFYDGSKLLATKTVAAGKASTTARLSVGKHTLKAVYLPSTAQWATSTASKSVTVAKAKPSVALTTKSWKVAKNSKPKVTVTVSGYSGAAKPTGKVVVKVGSTSITANLKSGKATVTLPKITKATTVSVTYKGSSSYSSATASHKISLK